MTWLHRLLHRLLTGHWPSPAKIDWMWEGQWVTTDQIFCSRKGCL